MSSNLWHIYFMEMEWTQVWDKMMDVQLGLMGELEEVMNPLGLTGLTFHVLRFLVEAGGHLKLMEVAGKVHHSQSGTTRLVDRMEKDGFLQRLACEADRRVTYAKITLEGERIFKEAKPLWHQLIQLRLGEPLGSESGEAYLKLLSKIETSTTKRDGICPLGK